MMIENKGVTIPQRCSPEHILIESNYDWSDFRKLSPAADICPKQTIITYG